MSSMERSHSRTSSCSLASHAQMQIRASTYKCRHALATAHPCPRVCKRWQLLPAQLQTWLPERPRLQLPVTAGGTVASSVPPAAADHASAALMARPPAATRTPQCEWPLGGDAAAAADIEGVRTGGVRTAVLHGKADIRLEKRAEARRRPRPREPCACFAVRFVCRVPAARRRGKVAL